MDLVRVEVFAYNVWMICRECEILFDDIVDKFFEKEKKLTPYEKQMVALDEFKKNSTCCKDHSNE